MITKQALDLIDTIRSLRIAKRVNSVSNRAANAAVNIAATASSSPSVPSVVALYGDDMLIDGYRQYKINFENSEDKNNKKSTYKSNVGDI